MENFENILLFNKSQFFSFNEKIILDNNKFELNGRNSKILETNECRSIRLTEKENNILKFLYKNLGNTVSRETLLHEVWGYNSKVTTHTLETHIYRLRQKFEDDPSNACFLITEPGGYKLRHK